MEELKKHLTHEIEKRGWHITSKNDSKYILRFITPKLKDLVQGDYKKDWIDGEYFLFEILFSYQENFIEPYCTVRRDENKSDRRNVLLDSLVSLKNNPNLEHSEWNCYEGFKFYINEYNTDKDSIAKLKDKITQHIEALVKKVEPLILSNKEQLTNTK
jgi:hypothetical protein